MSFSITSRLAVALCLGALALTGCASEESDGASGSSASTGSHSGEHSTSESPSPTDTSAAPADEAVEVVVAVVDGEVQPPTQRVKIEEGQQVRLVVTSDVDDELHVHGYDVAADLPAGQPATVEFLAHQTGLFEVETHDTELLLLQLEVR